MLIRRAVDIYLSQEEQDAVLWREQWGRAIEGTAGIAPHLGDGADYVEDLRRQDAERLDRLGS
jgi:hypothetical protein